MAKLNTASSSMLARDDKDGVSVGESMNTLKSLLEVTLWRGESFPSKKNMDLMRASP